MADITGDGINDVDIRALASSSTVNDVIFRQGTIGAGTGNFDSFLRLQASPTESGFNANTDSATNSEIKTGTWTHTIKLWDIPIKVVGGVQYYEFRLDINESNSNLISAQISLDTFKLYTSANGNIVDKAVLEAQNLAYNMDGAGNVSVLMSDAYSSGSGNSDYSVLVPVTSILGPDLTNPLVDPVTTYLYLYSQFGFAGANYQTTSTFEEWNVEHAVSLVGVKFNDINNDGQRQANGVDGIAGTADDEVGVAGVTIQLQDSAGNVLRTTTTNSTGTYTFYGVSTGVSYRVDEVVPTGSNQTTGDYETVAIADGASGTVTVDPIGNHYPVPNYTVSKTATSITGGVGVNGLTGANSAGDVVNYTIVVANTGELALTGYSISDPNATNLTRISGDTNSNNTLDVGETWTYTAQHTVTQAELDSVGTSITGALDNDTDTDNRVTVVTTNAGTKWADATTPLLPNPSFTLSKVATSITGGAGVNGLTGANSAGDVVNYTITVSNNGNQTLSGFTISDPNGTLGAVTGDDNDGNAGNGLVADGLLQVGETWTILGTHTVTQAELDAGGTSITGGFDTDNDTDNRVTVDFTQTAPQSADATTPLLPNPSFTLSKVATSITGGAGVNGLTGANSAGDVVNYTITVSNNGNQTLSGFTISDPNGTLGAVTGDDNDGNAGNGLVADGLLQVGETWTILGTHTVTQAELDAGGTSITGGFDTDNDTDNRVTVDFTQTAPQSADATTPLLPNPSFTLSKVATSITGGAGVNGLTGANSAGDVVNYTITVSNNGNQTLSGFTISDPNGTLGAVTGDDNDGNAGNGLVADGLLQVGETWTILGTHTVTQAELDAGGTSITGGFDTDNDTDNRVTVDFTQTAPQSADATTPLLPNPSFTLSKVATSITGGAGVNGLTGANSAGDVVNYTITVSNNGNQTLSGFTISDPNGTLGAVTGDDNDGNAGNGLVADGLLQVGETWTILGTHTVTQAELDAGGTSITGGFDTDNDTDNRVTVDFTQTAPQSADATTPLLPNPSFTLSKVATSITGGAGVNGLTGANSAGDVVNYTITVSNNGNQTLSGFTISDPNGTLGAVTGDDNDGNAGNGLVADGLLQVGETWTILGTHTVTQAELDAGGTSITGGFDTDNDTDNRVTVDFTQTAPQSADATTPLLPNPSFTLSKVATSITGGAGVNGLTGANSAGDVVNYTITVSNNGNQTLSGFTISDPNGTLGAVTGDDNDGNAGNGLVADGLLQVGETWTILGTHTVTQAELDAGGTSITGGFDTDNDTDNRVTVDFTQTAPQSADATTPLLPNPSFTLSKVATSITGGAGVNGLTGANSAGDVVNYTITVSNNGNQTLSGFTISDPNGTLGAVTGDDNDGNAGNGLVADGLLQVGETWTILGTHTVTQAELDAGGTSITGGFDTDNDTDNRVTVDFTQTAPQSADATTPLLPNPALTVVKEVKTDVVTTFTDANDPNGLAASTSSTVDFHVLITNTGNVTLSGISIDDDVVHTVAGVPSSEQLNYTTQNAWVDLDHSGTRAGDGSEDWATLDANNDGTLDTVTVGVGQNLNIYYSLTSLLGQHENTAKVTTAQGASGQDDANYYVLPTEDCVGVRTPGFWQNSKWATFWDAKGAAQSDQGDSWGGTENQPTQAGTPGFADGELVYKVYLSANDSDLNGSYTTAEKGAPSQGLLIGDYNMNGITDAGEDTLFIGLNDAKTLINASNKQLTGSQGDGAFMLGRDMVATWLNYLANNQEGPGGNCVGTVGGATNTPHEYLDAAIDWMQAFESNQNGTGNPGSAANQATFQFDKAIKTSTADWNNAYTGGAGTADDIPVSASAMHSALDGYNNTGSIGGIEYCCDADDPIALLALQQVA